MPSRQIELAAVAVRAVPLAEGMGPRAGQIGVFNHKLNRWQTPEEERADADEHTRKRVKYGRIAQSMKEHPAFKDTKHPLHKDVMWAHRHASSNENFHKEQEGHYYARQRHNNATTANTGD